MRNLTLISLSFILAACSRPAGKNPPATSKGVSAPAASAPAVANTCEGIRNFIAKELTTYADEVELAARAYQLEYWELATANPKATQATLSAAFEKLQKAQYNQEVLGKTLALWNDTSKVTNCPERAQLARAKELLETNIITDPAVTKKEKQNTDRQSAMSELSNKFRLTVEGEKEPISQAIFAKKLELEKDRSVRERLFLKHASERAHAWRGWGFADLVKSRNEEARLAGFPTYYEYSFYKKRIDLANYLAMAKQLKQTLSPKIKAVIQAWGKKEGLKEVLPWDVKYLKNKYGPGALNEQFKKLTKDAPLVLAKRFYRQLGIDIDKYGFQMDLFPRAGKETHAFAIGICLPHVDAKGNVLPVPKVDIRFLANLKTPVIWRDIGTVIHELGHTIHYAQMRQPFTLFLESDSTPAEAIAMTFERMSTSTEFLETEMPGITGVPLEKLKPIIKGHVEASKIDLAYSLMSQILYSEFEYEMYHNPDQDLSSLWRKLYLEFFGIDIPEEHAAWDVDHFLMAPVYVQSYTLGIVMVEQLYASILKDFKTSYRSVALGDKIKRVIFAPGQRYNYLEQTQQFTGKPLSTADVLNLIP